VNYLKKSVALLLVAVMVLALAACGSKSSSSSSSSAANSSSSSSDGSSSSDSSSSLYSKDTREILIGTWYEQYYTSDHQSVDDNPSVTNLINAQMQLDNMRAIEKKYNIELRFWNMTWQGVIESINTSIMAGKPDCAVYLVDLQFGIPAVLAGYAMSLEDILQRDAKASLVDEAHKDIFSDAGSVVVKTLNLSPGSADTYLFSANAINLAAYPLGYNSDLIKKYGLEDPADLMAKGEWTWEKWRAMMKAITQDTDSDGATDQWGFRGAWNVLFPALLMSNNAHIASPIKGEDGKVHEMLTSQPTIEALNFLHDMYQVDKVSFWDPDCDANWNDNVYAWAKQNIGFWVDQAWIAQEADPDQVMLKNRCVVTWPVGPSGNKDTNPMFNQTVGSYYIIPAGTEDAQQVYCVMYDFFNWYAGDTTLRDDDEWYRNWTYTDANFEVLKSMADEAKDYTMELWDQVPYDEALTIRAIIETGNSPDFQPIDVSTFVEANKNRVEDYVNKLFN